MRTESRVVMLTDIKGFTATTQRQTREENARMLRLHGALLSPVIAAFGGRHVKTIGDAYLVLFAAPTEALLCAAAIQDRLWDHGRRVVEADRIDVRIAVAMGDVRLDDGDVYGDAVNLASRIEGVAEPGEIWFAEALYWSLDRSRVPVEELGWRRLEGLPDEVRLFRVARAAATTEGDPPYAGIGLDLVAGLAPPEPDKLLRAVTRRQPTWMTGTSGTVVRLLVAVALAAGLGAGAWWLALPPADRSIRLGRFEEARRDLERLTAERGADDGEVLFLRGKLEVSRVEAAAGGNLRAGFQHWSRAVSVGHAGALAALEQEGRSPECQRRRLAARALAETRSQMALATLEDMARAEPPAPEAANPLERLKRAVAGDGRCGSGDLAREAIRTIEALHGLR